MDMEPTEEELDLAVEEFTKTYKAFEKAAKKLMAIMDSMNKKRNQELEALSGNSKQIHDFLIQIMDDSGQIGNAWLTRRKSKSKNYNILLLVQN